MCCEVNTGNSKQRKFYFLLVTYICINPRSRVATQDTTTVSDEIEKGAQKKYKINKYLNYIIYNI